MKNARSIILSLLMGIGLQQCGPLTGNGSETTNGFTLNIRNENGTAAANVRVVVRPADYVTPPPALGKTARTAIETFTDDSGRVDVEALQPGRYAIEMNDLKSTACLVRCTLDIRNGIQNLGTQIMKPFAVVVGTVDTTGDSGKKHYVQVFGLERISPVKPDGSFIIDSLPASEFTLRIISVDSSLPPTVFEGVQTLPGDTAIATIMGLKFVRKLYLNTTPSGAAVSKNILDFPVLVRLNSLTFDFSQVRSDGNDIRFFKSDNKPLPYEIERWDPVSGDAEMWVRIDTIFGNDSSHYFTMCWGASTTSTVGSTGSPQVSATASLSNSEAVFDTAKGFQAVWHLGQQGTVFADDATLNWYDGTPSDTAPLSIPALIGNGLQFDGKSNFLEMTGTASGKLDFPQDGTYSLSAWVYLDTVDTAQTFMFGKGHEQYLFQRAIIPGTTQWEFGEYHGTAGWQITQAPSTAREWKLLVGVRQGSEQLLYVDGVLVDNIIQIYSPPGLIERYTTNNFFIGKTPPLPNENPNYFKGGMDEVRVMNAAVDADWIKLCYMNQKAADALIINKK